MDGVTVFRVVCGVLALAGLGIIILRRRRRDTSD